MSLPMDYASVCCSYYIQICAITAQITDLEREEHDKKELYGGGGGGGVTTRIKKKFPPIVIINVLTQRRADNSFFVHI